MTRIGSAAWYDEHPTAPSWMEAQADAIFDARAAAEECRDTDPDLAAWWTREAERLEDQAWQRKARGRR